MPTPHPTAARFWLTLLWSLALGTLAIGWDWAEARLAGAAAAERLILAPRRALDASEQAAAAEAFRREPGLARAEWLAGEALQARLERDLPGAWLGAPGPPAAPLPELLELAPQAPLSAGADLQSLAARASTDWLVLWDAEHLARLREARLALRAAAATVGALMLVCGLLALRALPGSGWRGWWAGALAGTLVPGALGAALWLTGLPGFGPGQMLLGAATGLLLAAGAAGVLRQRGQPPATPRTGRPPGEVLEPGPLPGPARPARPLNVAIQESPDERNW